jgi:uncharacterized hydrophobic protein (TIGR00271 family)
MGSVEDVKAPEYQGAGHLRDWFADHIGVRPERKQEIYLDLAKSTTLRDTAYWLQILFAAGIATLGLVLNSPAVIIGAMLISPLMGPILAGGLALATGDVILGLRAVVNLTLSCIVAVGFAVLLVGLLPFKEMTGEIAARTRPTTLDLAVALFSGAIGSIATCKEVKGVVTSIPGVAIAVALMPPLCVVGYGLGFAFSLSPVDGLRIARGGGLLFLTNLVTITFTAMIVFLALHLDTDKVKERVLQWRKEDQESAWFHRIWERFPVPERIRKIGTLPGRFLVILIPILIILIPLSQSFSQLKREIQQQQLENRIRKVATQLWQQNWERLPSGEPRSSIDHLAIAEQEGKLTLYLRVFTSKPYTAGERSEFAHRVADRLDKPADSLELQLVEIPTASAELAAKATKGLPTEVSLTIAELQTRFLQRVQSALKGLRLPPPAQLVGYSIATNAAQPIHVVVSYLSDRDIDSDAQSLIGDEIRTRLVFPAATISLDRIPASPSQARFARNQAVVTAASETLLDTIGQTLRRQPSLRVELVGNAQNREPPELAQERAQAVADYLVSQWQISPDRLAVTSGQTSKRIVVLQFKLADAGS